MTRIRPNWLGKRFGKLVVIADDDPTPGVRPISVRCDCGRERNVRSASLFRGMTTNCGCIKGFRNPETQQKAQLKLRQRPKLKRKNLRQNWGGTRFNKLVVIADDDPTPNANRKILVHCDCGRDKRVQAGSLLYGTTTSCGCARGSKLKGRARTHGMSQTPTYNSWHGAKKRCNDPQNARYGGQGICFSDRWNRFEDFLEDMGIQPKGLTLDRIDPEGHYEPGNCRWADKSLQRRNQMRKSEVEFSRFKGVHKQLNRFIAMISVRDKSLYLGSFTKEISAAKAYDRAAVKYHKERAVTNAMLGRL